MVLPVLPMFLVASVRYRRIRDRVLVQQRMLLRRRQMRQMMNLMRHRIGGGPGAVAMHNRHRMALARRLLAVRYPATYTRRLRPPDPRGGHDAGAESHD